MSTSMRLSERVATNIPPMIKEYTDRTIPTEITDDEIDVWLAILPDLIEFWEAEVAEKKLESETAEQGCKMAQTIAFNETNTELPVKTRENLANVDTRVIEAAKMALTAKYTLQLTQAVFDKIEHKSKSIHKIAALRARRLEAGVVASSIKTKAPYQPWKQNDIIRKELAKESRDEMNQSDPF